MGSMQLPPGFRFHPTDEELVGYYLKRKVEGLKIELEVIPVIDLYKFDPWELPDKSFLPKRDMEWFFFCPRDRKYPNGSRTNRATGSGYWKATGKDRKIVSHSAVTGFRKTLVFYRGRAPLGDRTDWVMHEYRLFEDVSQGSSGFWGAFALCRVVKKNDQGQKVGNQQGEPKIRRGVSSNMNDSRSACEFANSSEKNPSQANNQVNEETTSGIRTSLELERAVADTDQTCLWESHDQQSNASKDFREAGEINSSWVPGNGFPKSNLPWQLCDPMELQSPPYSKFIHEVDPGENHSPMRFELPYLSPINCTGLCSDMDTVFQSFDRLHSFDLSNVSTAITGFEPMNSMMPPSICRETSGDGNFVEVSNLWGYDDISLTVM